MNSAVTLDLVLVIGLRISSEAHVVSLSGGVWDGVFRDN